jgi:hypothetical protein
MVFITVTGRSGKRDLTFTAFARSEVVAINRFRDWYGHAHSIKTAPATAEEITEAKESYVSSGWSWRTGLK